MAESTVAQQRPIVTHAEAKASGLKRYFTGQECVSGHLTYRNTASGVCADCNRDRAAQWRRDNPEKQVALSRAWYSKNSDYRKAKSREWYAENKERLAPVKAAWVKANPDKQTQYCQLKNSRRRARVSSAPGNHTASDKLAIFAAQGGKCAYCKVQLKKATRHLDHIIPLAAGGSNGRQNLQYTCSSCNLSKGARDPVEFARARGLLL